MTTDDDHAPEPLEELPTPRVRPARQFSFIWLVPIVASVIAAVLAVKAIIETGPAVTIEFASAEGLEAGKTRIRYKDIEVGKVGSIQLEKGLTRVTVKARMVPEVAPYLTATTRFWVVRARVAAGEISGLGTLFSGAYIAMEPGRKGPEVRQFKGLAEPPLVTLDMPGRYFNLRAAKLGSLDVGAPVYYRQIKVGQVVNYHMKADGSAVEVQIFIEAPNDQRVNRNTRFWNASGVNVDVSASGVRINTESLVTLLEGGIAFETPANLVQGGPVDEKRHVFTLYPSHEQINEPVYAEKVYFISYFDETVRGLAVGAPVEFRGIKIGEVADIRLEFNPEEASFRIPVLSYIEPERIVMTGRGEASDKDIWAKLVKKGLRAQLRTGVLLTGQLYINLDIHPEAKPEELRIASGYPVLPTVPEPVQEITTSVSQILAKLQKVPIEQIGKDLRQAVANVKHLSGSAELDSAVKGLTQSLDQLHRFTLKMNTDLAPRMQTLLDQTDKAMAAGQRALTAAEKMLNSESPLSYECRQALQEVEKAARSVNALAQLLEQNPQALIYGKPKQP
jgi:paraquat-inducible protein B